MRNTTVNDSTLGRMSKCLSGNRSHPVWFVLISTLSRTQKRAYNQVSSTSVQLYTVKDKRQNFSSCTGSQDPRILSSQDNVILGSFYPRILSSQDPFILGSFHPRIFSSQDPRVLTSQEVFILGLFHPSIVLSHRRMMYWISGYKDTTILSHNGFSSDILDKI